MRDLKPPFTIDEIQYAPQVLSPIKRLVDGGAPPGLIWLTGSQSFDVMRGVQESLAGKVAILNLFGLSDEEKAIHPRSSVDLFQSCFYGFARSELRRHGSRHISPSKQPWRRLSVCRAGTHAGAWWLRGGRGSRRVSTRQAKVPAPRHRLDTGLCGYLAGWSDPEQLYRGPMGGAMLETHVFNQILRLFRHRVQEGRVHFWRTRDGQEIDFLVEIGGAVVPIEVKYGMPGARQLPRLDRLREPNWRTGVVISLAALASESGARARITEEWRLVAPNAEGYRQALSV